MAVVALLAAPCAGEAAGRQYKAQRFDASIKVLSGGDLLVTETITFEFQAGTFQEVWRELRTDRTDGIDVQSASMDGRPLVRGPDPGQYGISGRNRIRVTWHFAPTGPSVHTFALTYHARGVGRPLQDADEVAWYALPTEHAYRIGASRITIEGPEPPSAAPGVESRGVGQATTAVAQGVIAVDATDVRQNGWVLVRLQFPRGHIAPAPPQWERQHQYASSMTPRWLLAAAGVLVLGVVLVIVLRSSYQAPNVPSSDATETTPPDALAPALVATLLARGRVNALSGLATLLDLADRGVIGVREERRSLVRHYELTQVPGTHTLAGHEEEALTIAFAGKGDDVSIAKARGRLARGGRRFSRAVEADLDAVGLFDRERKAVGDRLTRLGVTLLFIAPASVAAFVPFVPRYEGWPFLVPLAILLTAVIALVAGSTTTALSDEGAATAARWKAFKRHVKTVAGTKDQAVSADAPARWTIYAVAMGLAYTWSKYLKRHPGTIPPWFAAAAQDPGDASAAWVAFVGSSAVNSGGGASGAGGGAAAGGGGSGAA